jgi:two-component system OmpR family sensor kinase
MRPWPFDRRLSALLASSIIAVAVLAAIASFMLSYREAKELQDDALLQVAALASENEAQGAQSRITILKVPEDRVPAWLPSPLAAGYATVQGPDGAATRVFVLDGRDGRRVIVLQDMTLIDDVAVGAAFQAFVPALLLIPLVAWLTLRALESERRRVEAERRFIADAAHELRSPLTALTIQAENVDSAASPETVRTRMTALRDGIARARRVAEQMLAMARVHSANEKGQPVDAAQLAREVIADALDFATQREVDLGLDEQAHPTLWGSPDTLRLVLKNAVDNAVRHGRRGGTVTVRVLEEGDEGVIQVDDDGPGVSPEFIAQGFQPFRRMSPAQEGSGLGLAIANDAARRLGGSIVLRNRDASGLSFVYRQRVVAR